MKRIFAVTTLTNDNNGSQYVTERNQTMKELEVPPSISGNKRISVFVNPLSMNGGDNFDSLPEDDSMVSKRSSAGAVSNVAAEDVLKTAKRFKKPEIYGRSSTGSLDESLFESVNSTPPANATKKKERSEDTKKLNGDAGSSSLDSITNSLDSSPEISNRTQVSITQHSL